MKRSLLALFLCSCATTGAVALDHAVMAYDRTVVDVVSKLLLLNIARAHRDMPVHFTTVSSIAATYNFQFNAGVGPAVTGEWGWLPTPALGGSTSENPTITITPMQGDEFTQRLLTPFTEEKVTILLQQGYDVDALLRLMGSEIHFNDGDKTALNRPSERDGYALFRQVVVHLSSIQDRNALHVDRIADKARVVIANYDPWTLSPAEREALLEEATRSRPNEVLIDVRPGHPGGEWPLHVSLRLRSFLGVLDFIGRGIAAEPEYDVAADARTPVISDNPARTLAVVEGAPSGSELVISLAGKDYALQPDHGYAWNKKAFSVLYQLFQMSVSPAPTPAPLITISK